MVFFSVAGRAGRFKKADVSFENEFLDACRRGDEQGAKDLYEIHSLSVSKTRTSDGGNLFFDVCSAKGLGTPEVVVKYLLHEAGADPRAKLPNGQMPLMVAAQAGNVGAISALLDEELVGLTFQENMSKGYGGMGSTALLLACRKGHAGAALILLRKGGVSVKRRDNVGVLPARSQDDSGGPLHWAALHG
mgnify:CR=1 FL=1